LLVVLVGNALLGEDALWAGAGGAGVLRRRLPVPRREDDPVLAGDQPLDLGDEVLAVLDERPRLGDELARGGVQGVELDEPLVHGPPLQGDGAGDLLAAARAVGAAPGQKEKDRHRKEPSRAARLAREGCPACKAPRQRDCDWRTRGPSPRASLSAMAR